MHKRMFLSTFFNVDLKELNLGVGIHSFAASLISIFIPIYMLTIDFSLSEVFLFLFVYHLVAFLAGFFSGKSCAYFGTKNTMLIGIGFQVFFFMFLPQLEYGRFLLLPLAVLIGLYDSFYWVPYREIFIRSSDTSRMGKEYGFIKGMQNLAAIFAPLTGAIILTFFGMNYLVLVVSILILLSMIPIFKIKHSYFNKKYKLKKLFKNKIDIKNIIKLTIRGINDGGESFIWPVFVFLILGDVLEIGVLGSITALATTIFYIVVGIASDHVSKTRILRLGALSLAIVWLLRMFTDTPITIFLVTFIGSLMIIAIETGLFSNIFGRAKKMKLSEQYSIASNSISMLGKAFLFLVIFFVLKLVAFFPVLSVLNVILAVI